jgi:malonate transporter
MLGLSLVLPLMIIIITGNLLRARGFYSKNDVDTLTKTLYWVILPPLLFRATLESGREVLSQPNLLISLNICYILTIIIAWGGAKYIFHKDNRLRIATAAFSSIRANNLYLGFPVMYIAMGDAGLHNASVYLAVSTVSFQLFSIVAGEAILCGRPSFSVSCRILRNIALNPLVISCVAGILLALFGVERLPRELDEAMRIMGSAATAVALLALGGTLELSGIGKVISMIRSTWPDSAIKLLIHPALMWGLLVLFPVPRPLLQATVMLSSMPSAVNCFILAKAMGMDWSYAADLVASTTVLGIISIPLWAHVLGIV